MPIYRWSYLLAVVGLILVNKVIAQENPLAAFKLLGVKTDCVVERLMPANTDASAVIINAEQSKTLSDTEAAVLYDCVVTKIKVVNKNSPHNVASNYLSWTRFSTSPYRSSTHGNRYVNNYANEPAAEHYQKYEQADQLPIGSIIAKDSFVIDEDGQAVIGALSLMEKMYQGYNPKYGDWRYMLILPDGTLFTSTGAVQSASVAFCGDCHQANAVLDSLFFVPLQYRLRTEQ